VEVARGLGVNALVAGHVEEGPKRVLIDPLGVEFTGDELQLR
jgi:phosphoribosylformylglycinamidine cyclo-ligase